MEIEDLHETHDNQVSARCRQENLRCVNQQSRIQILSESETERQYRSDDSNGPKDDVSDFAPPPQRVNNCRC